MTIDLTRRAALGALVVRSQATGSPAAGNAALIEEEVLALHELLSEDLGPEMCADLNVF